MGGIAHLFRSPKCNVDEYIILCIDGEPHKNIMVPLNGAVRINIDSTHWNVPSHETNNYCINLYKGVFIDPLLIRVDNEVRVIFVQIFGQSLFMG